MKENDVLYMKIINFDRKDQQGYEYWRCTIGLNRVAAGIRVHSASQDIDSRRGIIVLLIYNHAHFTKCVQNEAVQILRTACKARRTSKIK